MLKCVKFGKAGEKKTGIDELEIFNSNHNQGVDD